MARNKIINIQLTGSIKNNNSLERINICKYYPVKIREAKCLLMRLINQLKYLLTTKSLLPVVYL